MANFNMNFIQTNRKELSKHDFLLQARNIEKKTEEHTGWVCFFGYLVNKN